MGSTLPSEIAEEFARKFYKSLCLYVILNASEEVYSDGEIMERVFSLMDLYFDDEEKNVN